MGVDRLRVRIVADEDDLARLIRTDGQADARLLENFAQRVGVDAAQGVGLGGGGRFSSRIGYGGVVGHGRIIE